MAAYGPLVVLGDERHDGRGALAEHVDEPRLGITTKSSGVERAHRLPITRFFVPDAHRDARGRPPLPLCIGTRVLRIFDIFSVVSFDTCVFSPSFPLSQHQDNRERLCLLSRERGHSLHGICTQGVNYKDYTDTDVDSLSSPARIQSIIESSPWPVSALARKT